MRKGKGLTQRIRPLKSICSYLSGQSQAGRESKGQTGDETGVNEEAGGGHGKLLSWVVRRYSADGVHRSCR